MISLRTRHDFFYFQIATRYYLNYIKLQTEFISEENREKMNNLISELEEHAGKKFEKVEFEKLIEGLGVKDFTFKMFQLRSFGTISVVFSALCLEALINDYCVFKKSASFLAKYVDKLDPLSKWKIFPELFTGKSLSTDRKAFELLKELFSFRNSLIHPKSKILEPIQDITDEKNPLIQDFVEYVGKYSRSYIAIKEATNELHTIDSDFTYLNEYECLWSKDLNKFRNISDIETFYLSMINDIRFGKE